MRLHVLAQPHTQITKEYIRCAYTQKILKLAQMMVKEGHEVFLYASEDNETPATLVTCITKKEQAKLGFVGPQDYLKNDFDNTKPLWKIFHQRALHELKQRASKGDIIGTFSGLADKPIADGMPECYFSEIGVGYSGCFSPFRVYESYAWMHTIYGAGSNGNASSADGRFYDTVIPNYFDPSDFLFEPVKKNYVLFMGRMIYRKGLKIIEEVAKRLPDTQFILAGQGATQEGDVIKGQDVTIEGKNLMYIGAIDVEKRGRLMAEAKALICPTQYVGPFEGVSVEAMFCGTPAITTDFGCFTENNPNGLTGYRCSTIKEFVEAINSVDKLDPVKIREYAMSRFSVDVVAPMYTKYFERIKGLERGGFYEK